MLSRVQILYKNEVQASFHFIIFFLSCSVLSLLVMFYDFHCWLGILLIFVCGLHVAFLVLGCFYHVVTCSFHIVFILVMLLPLLSCCYHLFHIVVALHILYTLLPLALLFHMLLCLHIVFLARCYFRML